VVWNPNKTLNLLDVSNPFPLTKASEPQPKRTNNAAAVGITSTLINTVSLCALYSALKLLFFFLFKLTNSLPELFRLRGWPHDRALKLLVRRGCNDLR
jgi:hypothetical protein